jgi:metallo-beta-lactamase family protein
MARAPILRPLGAAQTVTGSCLHVDTAEGVMLVDCGMFQGPKTLAARNYAPFPFDPAGLHSVLLTHAHLDHTGLVPRLAREGFRGTIYTTAPTLDLLGCMWPDAAHIQEEDVDRLNRRRLRRGEAPVRPIYDDVDVERALDLVRPVPFDAPVAALPGVVVRFRRAGHILGAASIELELARAGVARPWRVLISGDIGDGGLERPAEPGRDFDFVFCESTYGDREQEKPAPAARRALLAAELAAARAANGVVIVPVFAVERAQQLLIDLGTVFRQGAAAPVPVHLDSPLAHRTTDVFRRWTAALGPDAGADALAFPQLHIVETREASAALAQARGGAVILAGSGMCEAGRVREHLRAHLWKPSTRLLLVGYQAPGTLGRLLLDGADRVRIHGDEVRVAAHIRTLDAYSAHADQRGLVAWIERCLPIRRALCLVHGEPSSMEALRSLLQARGFAAPIVTPALGARLALDADDAALAAVAMATDGKAVGRPDSHNQYAALLLELRRRLDAEPDEAARQALLSRLRATLETGMKSVDAAA